MSCHPSAFMALALLVSIETLACSHCVLDRTTRWNRVPNSTLCQPYLPASSSSATSSNAVTGPMMRWSGSWSDPVGLAGVVNRFCAA